MSVLISKFMANKFFRFLHILFSWFLMSNCIMFRDYTLWFWSWDLRLSTSCIFRNIHTVLCNASQVNILPFMFISYHSRSIYCPTLIVDFFVSVFCGFYFMSFEALFWVICTLIILVFMISVSSSPFAFSLCLYLICGTYG